MAPSSAFFTLSFHNEWFYPLDMRSYCGLTAYCLRVCLAIWRQDFCRDWGWGVGKQFTLPFNSDLSAGPQGQSSTTTPAIFPFSGLLILSLLTTYSVEYLGSAYTSPLLRKNVPQMLYLHARMWQTRHHQALCHLNGFLAAEWGSEMCCSVAGLIGPGRMPHSLDFSFQCFYLAMLDWPN